MRQEIGHEEAFHRRTDHWLFGQTRSGTAFKELRRRHDFTEASYYLWRSKFGGMNVPDAKRLKELEAKNVLLKKPLAESLMEMKAVHEALRKKWWAPQRADTWRFMVSSNLSEHRALRVIRMSAIALRYQ